MTPLPFQAVPLALPLVAYVGDNGVVLQAHLAGGDNGYVFLPTNATVAFSANEQIIASIKERRAPRSFGGVATVDMSDASLVSYAFQSSDLGSPGFFNCFFRVTYVTSQILTFPVGSLEIVCRVSL